MKEKRKVYKPPVLVICETETQQPLAAGSGSIQDRPDYNQNKTGFDQSVLNGRNNYQKGGAYDWDQDD